MLEVLDEAKIALIGSHGVGKTSQLPVLAQAFGLPALGELATIVAKDLGYGRITDIPAEELVAFQWAILHQQIARELQAGSYVSDRSTCCNAAYWTRYTYGGGHATEGEHRAYLQLARAHAQTYTHLIFFPIRFALEDDGFRHLDPTEQREIEDLVLRFIQDWGLMDRLYVVQENGKIARAVELVNFLEDSFCTRRAAVDEPIFEPLLARPEVAA